MTGFYMYKNKNKKVLSANLLLFSLNININVSRHYDAYFILIILTHCFDSFLTSTMNLTCF